MPQDPPQSLDPPPSSPATVQPGEPRILVQVANACRVRHLAYSTEQSYVPWVKRFILFHNMRHPRDMWPSEVRADHQLPTQPKARAVCCLSQGRWAIIIPPPPRSSGWFPRSCATVAHKRGNHGDKPQWRVRYFHPLAHGRSRRCAVLRISSIQSGRSNTPVDDWRVELR